MRDRLNSLTDFIRGNWFWGAIILVIIAIAVFIQQIILILLSGTL
jgi:hypothetical protein